MIDEAPGICRTLSLRAPLLLLLPPRKWLAGRLQRLQRHQILIENRLDSSTGNAKKALTRAVQVELHWNEFALVPFPFVAVFNIDRKYCTVYTVYSTL